MRAAVLHGKEDVRIEEVPCRPLAFGEVRVRIEAALTCGTDLKVYKRGYHARMIVPPAVFGHELAGSISEVAPGLKEWFVGDRVVAANSAPCGDCYFCLKHQENLCDDLQFLNGAYAESIVIPERFVRKNLLKLKPLTAFRDAALVEPLACVVQGLTDLKPEPGDRVLILGAGPIGLMFAALLLQSGCAVTTYGRGETRLQFASRLGASIVPASGSDPAATLKAASPAGFDIVVEAIGKPEMWEAAVALVRKGGKVNFFGGCPSGAKVSLDTGLIHYSSLTLLASFHHTPRSIRRALELVENGSIRAEDFVDGDAALSELPEVLRRMASGNHSVKTFVRVRD